MLHTFCPNSQCVGPSAGETLGASAPAAVRLQLLGKKDGILHTDRGQSDMARSIGGKDMTLLSTIRWTTKGHAIWRAAMPDRGRRKSMKRRIAPHAICLALLVAIGATGPAGAWQTVVKKDFVPPDGTLVIFGASAARHEAVTVSCVIDSATHSVRRLFVDVTATVSGAGLPKGDAATIVMRQAGAPPVNLPADIGNSNGSRVLATSSADDAIERRLLLSWIEPLVDGGELMVSIEAAPKIAVAFSIASDATSDSAAKFLASCIP
jgi:hypothetical protein